MHYRRKHLELKSTSLSASSLQTTTLFSLQNLPDDIQKLGHPETKKLQILQTLDTSAGGQEFHRRLQAMKLYTSRQPQASQLLNQMLSITSIISIPVHSSLISQKSDLESQAITTINRSDSATHQTQLQQSQTKSNMSLHSLLRDAAPMSRTKVSFLNDAEQPFKRIDIVKHSQQNIDNNRKQQSSVTPKKRHFRRSLLLDQSQEQGDDPTSFASSNKHEVKSQISLTSTDSFRKLPSNPQLIRQVQSVKRIRPGYCKRELGNPDNHSLHSFHKLQALDSSFYDSQGVNSFAGDSSTAFATSPPVQVNYSYIPVSNYLKQLARLESRRELVNKQNQFSLAKLQKSLDFEDNFLKENSPRQNDLEYEADPLISKESKQFQYNELQHKRQLNLRSKVQIKPQQPQSLKLYQANLFSQVPKQMHQKLVQNDGKILFEGQNQILKFKKIIAPSHHSNEKSSGSSVQNTNYSKEESFNIYGEFGLLSRQFQSELAQKLVHFRGSGEISRFIQIESAKIQQKLSISSDKNEEIYKNAFKNLATTSIDTILSIEPMLTSSENLASHRDELDVILSKVCAISLQSKNLVIISLCARTAAKITRLNKNYVEAIAKYKYCKNIAKEHSELFRYLLNSYKNIALCFSHLRQHKLSLHYFYKMLRMAWYINDPDKELNAYDLIGLQYFYLSNLSVAQFYHDKLLDGQIEPATSDLRRLGISKIDISLRRQEGRVATPTSRVRRRMMRRLENSEVNNEFEVSSESDDCSDIPLQLYEKRNLDQLRAEQGERCKDSESEWSREQSEIQKMEGGSIVRKEEGQGAKHHYSLQFAHHDKNQAKIVKQTANQNIRMAVEARQKRFAIDHLSPERMMKAHSLKQIKGASKNPLRLSHLSVNSDVSNYQILDTQSNKLSQVDFASQMFDLHEPYVKAKIKLLLSRLKHNLSFAKAHLQMHSEKLRSTTNKLFSRRFAILLPQRSSTQIKGED